MIKLLKKAGLSILAIGLLITNIPIVEAKASFGVTIKGLKASGGGSGEWETPEPTIEEKDGYGISASCKYQHSGGVMANRTHWVNFYAYDQEDNEIMEKDFGLTKENSPKAGTSLGLVIEEERHIFWSLERAQVNVQVKIYEYKKKYECKYQTKELSSGTVPKPERFDGYRAEFQKYNPESYSAYSNVSLTPIVAPVNCDSTMVYGSDSCPSKVGCEFKGKENKGYDKSQKTEVVNINVNLENQDEISGKYKNEILEQFEKCKFAAASYSAEVASWYTGADYDIVLTDSNDINGTNTVKIPATESYAKYYKYTNATSGKNALIDLYENEGLSSETVKQLEEKGYRFSAECKTMDPNKEDSCLKFKGPDDKPIEMDSVSIYTYYAKQATCMNLKTGKVRYISNGSSDACNPDTELTIENTTTDGVTHWHYFIPLNAKTTDTIKLEMLKPGGIEGLEPKTCVEYMQQNYISANGNSEDITYEKIIRPKNDINGVFKGDYICYPMGDGDCDEPKDVTWKEESSDYKEVMANGCILSTQNQFTIKQQFYNEKTTASSSETVFNGFNLFYKPIDIKKENQVDIVFTEGKKYIGNSLWNDWYDEWKTPTSISEPLDLSKSFNEITYIASDISAREVRRYNKDNPYTSWSNMNIDGTSNYIKTTATGSRDSVIRRINVTTDDIYKLGCGPANSNEFLLDENGYELLDVLGNPITNPLYIKGCEIK